MDPFQSHLGGLFGGSTFHLFGWFFLLMGHTINPVRDPFCGSISTFGQVWGDPLCTFYGLFMDPTPQKRIFMRLGGSIFNL